jgi:hypothetical protein
LTTCIFSVMITYYALNLKKNAEEAAASGAQTKGANLNTSGISNNQGMKNYNIQREKDHFEKMRQLDKLLKNDLFIGGLIRPREYSDRYLLSYEDFDRVFRIIQKHAMLRLDLALEEGTEKRLNLLKGSGMYAGLNGEYRELVLKSYSHEE